MNNSQTAIKGFIPQSIQTTNKQYREFEHIRFTLKNAWNTNYKRQLQGENLKKSITTPYRAVNNAGDLLSRKNYSCGGTCQSVQSRPNVRGIKGHLGSVQNSCRPSDWYNSLQMLRDVPASACNVKFVYDSSDYVTYLKQKAILSNYNDLTYGGNSSSTSQSAMRAIRR